jgi:hypothetical protein
MVKRAETSDSTPINEHILEVRYVPNPKVLDYRGSWANALAQALGLPKWNIVENRLDVFTEDRNLRVFISFKNFGVVVQDAPTQNYFTDQTQRFLKHLLELTGFDHPVRVERYGVRLRVATPFHGSFEDLRDRVAQRYLSVASGAVDAIGSTAKLRDIGAPLNFTDEIGDFDSHCGPMVKAQLEQFFKGRKNLPGVALYYDIDYFTKPDEAVSDQRLIGRVAQCAAASHQRYERIRKLILEA